MIYLNHPDLFIINTLITKEEIKNVNPVNIKHIKSWTVAIRVQVPPSKRVQNRTRVRDMNTEYLHIMG